MKKKKILLLSDDLRMHSGVATVSKDIVINTIHHYDWVQLAGAITHPEEGKVADMSEVVKSETGINDPYLRLYPTSGYGNPELLRQILAIEKPDAILHYTDPRFWTWLYDMEHELRQDIPIFYNNIWDDLPDPKWNTDYYKSCDLLVAISKQTYGINKRLLPHYEDWQIKYIPHGINDKRFYVVNPQSQEMVNFNRKYKLDKYKFKVLYSNRNIRRKLPGDVVMAYKHFVEQLPLEEQKECALVFHTSPIDDNGTDLYEVCENMMPEQNVVFTYDVQGAFDDNYMNLLFNSIDVYINIASNEGFGLGSCEALTVEKPIIVTVTGGLQDQCGFMKDGKRLTAEDYIELGSNHTADYTEHGEWAEPVFPACRSLQGSPPTPYIFDDRVRFEDAGEALLKVYNYGPEERKRRGKLGREFVKDKEIAMDAKMMGDLWIDAMDVAFKKWTPRQRYSLEAV